MPALVRRILYAPGQAGTLAGARIFAYAAGTITPIVLARRLPSDEFGGYRDVLLLGFTVVQILQLGLPQSLFYFLPSNNPDRGKALTQAVLVLSTVAAILGILLATNGWLLTAVFHVPELEPVAPLVAAYVAGMLVTSLLDALLLAEGRVRLASAVTIGSEGMRSVLLLAVVLLAPSLPWLVGAMALVAALRVLVLVWAVRPYARGQRWVSRALIRAQLRFSGPFALALLLATAASQIDKYFVSFTFGPSIFAIYALGLTQVPLMDILFNSHSEVLLPRMRRSLEAGRPEEIVALWRSTVATLAGFVLPALGYLLVVAPDVITTLYGEKYAESAPIFAVFLLTLPRYIAPYGVIPRVYGRTGFVLGATLASVLVTFPLLAVLTAVFGLVGAAAAGVVALYVISLPQVVMGGRLVGAGVRSLMPWDHLGRIVGVVAVATALAAGLKMTLGLSGAPALLAAGLVYGVAYTVLGIFLRILPAAVLSVLRLPARSVPMAQRPTASAAPFLEK